MHRHVYMVDRDMCTRMTTNTSVLNETSFITIYGTTGGKSARASPYKKENILSFYPKYYVSVFYCILLLKLLP